jgi:hypothetical protein
MCATCSTHLFPFDLYILIILVCAEDNKLWISSLCNSLQRSLTALNSNLTCSPQQRFIKGSVTDCQNLQTATLKNHGNCLPYCSPKKLNTVAWVCELTTDWKTVAFQWSECQRFADRGCHMASVTNFYGRILGFLDRSLYFFFQVAPPLYSGGWVDPVPEPLLLRKSGSNGNRTPISGSVARRSDH